MISAKAHPQINTNSNTSIITYFPHYTPPTKSNALMSSFHIIEELSEYLFGFQIHSIIELGVTYFCSRTTDHKFYNLIRCQEHFVANILEKRNRFLRPHPPIDFGVVILCHRIQGITKWSLCPCHRKREHIRCAFSIIHFGIQDRAIQ
jgi:hypothetical protein